MADDTNNALEDALRIRNELAQKVGMPSATVQDILPPGMADSHALWYVQNDAEKLIHFGDYVSAQENIAALENRTFDRDQTQAAAEEFYKNNKITVEAVDSRSRVNELKNAENLYVRAAQSFAEVQARDMDAPPPFDAQAIRAKAEDIIKEQGRGGLVDMAKALRHDAQNLFEQQRASIQTSKPDSVRWTENGTTADHIDYLAQARQHIAHQAPDKPNFQQRLHSDAAPVGDPSKPALLDASYPYQGRHLLSVAYPDFVPSAQSGFNDDHTARSLEKLFESYGIETSQTKLGHSRDNRTFYVEMDVSEADYAKGRHIIDTIVRSQETDPQKLQAEIDNNLRTHGIDVPTRHAAADENTPRPPGTDQAQGGDQHTAADPRAEPLDTRPADADPLNTIPDGAPAHNPQHDTPRVQADTPRVDAPDHAGGGSGNSRLSTGMAVTGLATGGNRLAGALESGDKGEMAMGVAEMALAGTETVMEIAGKGRSAGMVGAGITVIDGLYQTGKTVMEADSVSEAVVEGGQTLTRTVADGAANIFTIGMAGGAAGVLVDREFERAGEQNALYTRAFNMASGAEDMNVMSLAHDQMQIWGRDLDATGDALMATTPVQLVQDVTEIGKTAIEISEINADLRALHTETSINQSRLDKVEEGEGPPITAYRNMFGALVGDGHRFPRGEDGKTIPPDPAELRQKLEQRVENLQQKLDDKSLWEKTSRAITGTLHQEEIDLQEARTGLVEHEDYEKRYKAWQAGQTPDSQNSAGPQNQTVTPQPLVQNQTPAGQTPAGQTPTGQMPAGQTPQTPTAPSQIYWAHDGADAMPIARHNSTTTMTGAPTSGSDVVRDGNIRSTVAMSAHFGQAAEGRAPATDPAATPTPTTPAPESAKPEEDPEVVQTFDKYKDRIASAGISV